MISADCSSSATSSLCNHFDNGQYEYVKNAKFLNLRSQVKEHLSPLDNHDNVVITEYQFAI